MRTRCKRLLALLLSSIMLLSGITVNAEELPEPEQYTLTVKSDNGTVDISGEGVTETGEDTYSIIPGSTVTAKAETEDGYELNGMKLDEDTVEYSDGTAVFEMPDHDSILSVEYSQIIPEEEQEEEIDSGDKSQTDQSPDDKKKTPEAENDKSENVADTEVKTEDADDVIARAHSIAMAGLPKSLFARSRSARATEHLSTGAQLNYGGARTHRYSVGGQEAYCIEPCVSSPASGEYAVIDAYTIDVDGYGALDLKYLRAAMWFSYGAPGFDASMWPSSYFDGTGMDADNYRICSHLLMSKVFQNSSSAVRANCSAAFYNWYSTQITGDYMTNPSANRNNAWNQITYGGRASEVPDTFEVKFLYTGNGTQLIAFWEYQPMGNLTLVKTSANPALTNGNSCYSLAGAVYGIYTDRACTNRVAALTTIANGTSNVVEITAGTYYAKETTAPKGYALDQTVYPITVTAGNTATLRVTDLPQNDPVSVLLGKIDAETTKNMPQGSASLEGAQFTVKYYDGYYSSDPAQQGKKAIRTWVFETNEYGFLYFSNMWKVSGDSFYYDSTGIPTIPLGTITIQETKAPEGYLLNDKVFIRQITADGPAEGVETYNEPEVKEDIMRGDLELVKFAEPEDEEEDHMLPLDGIIFTLTSKTTGDIFEITTDERGFATTKELGISDRGNLVFDTYVVHETNTPEGLEPVDDFEVTISQEGQVLYYILEDKQVVSPVQLMKVDETTGQTIPIADTEFQLLDEDKNPISMTTYYPNKVVHETFKTDATGTFTLPEKLPAGVYYFRELNAPEGYLLNGNDLKFEITKSHDWEEPLMVTFEDAPAMGRIEIVKTDADYGYPLMGAEFAITAAEDIVTPDGTVRAVAGETVDTVTTGPDGRAESKDLYLGKYTVTETKQPGGYVLPDRSWDVELVYQDQHTAIVTENLEVKNTPTKVIIQKVESGTDKPLAGVEFEVWNKAMLEDEIDPGFAVKEKYVTGGDGTIALKRLLPGTYCVQETATIAGYVLDQTVYEFTVSEDGHIDGKDTYTIKVKNDRIMNPELHTTAIDLESGTHEAIAKEDITIRDKVDYRDIIPGSYKLVGILMDQETEKPLLVDGKQVTAEKEVTISETNGTLTMDFTLDASELNGKATVVFEYLYPVNPDNPDEYADTPVASHEDIHDKDQTVAFRVGSLIPFLPGQHGSGHAPQTGDVVSVLPYLVLLVAAGAGSFTLIKLRKRKKGEEETENEDGETPAEDQEQQGSDY